MGVSRQISSLVMYQSRLRASMPLHNFMNNTKKRNSNKCQRSSIPELLLLAVAKLAIGGNFNRSLDRFNDRTSLRFSVRADPRVKVARACNIIETIATMSDSDDDQPRLSWTTLAALEEFLKERSERENLSKCVSEKSRLPSAPFDEDWQLSQFWYDDETTETFVRGALNSTTENGKIALISCPTLYSALKERCGVRQISLFEYDTRFKIFGVDFVQYDYKSPLDVPRSMSNQFDLVIADPPFLSDECLTKTAVTVKFLAKRNIVLCTGAVMAELAEKLLDVRKCNFVPSHRSNLANEFHCYSNFDFDKALK